jgi:hypothetical protein
MVNGTILRCVEMIGVVAVADSTDTFSARATIHIGTILRNCWGGDRTAGR